MSSAVCLVLVPHVRTPDSRGYSVDYTVVYETVIKPAVSDVGLQPVRADTGLHPLDKSDESILDSFASVPLKFLSGACLALTRARQRLAASLRLNQHSSERHPSLPVQPVLDAISGLELARRQSSPVAVQSVLRDLERAGRSDPAVLIDAMLSYRVMKAWRVMVEFIDSMPTDLRGAAEIQEQRAYALNQEGRSEEAERTLLELNHTHGKSPATLELLGWVYRTRWKEVASGDGAAEAQKLLGDAIDAYVEGFLLDPRNALEAAGSAMTLMEIGQRSHPRRDKLFPLAWNLAQLLAVNSTTYSNHATLLELAVIQRDTDMVGQALTGALRAVRAPWQPEETARNLWDVHQARESRGEKEFQPAVNATWELRRAVSRSTALATS